MLLRDGHDHSLDGDLFGDLYPVGRAGRNPPQRPTREGMFAARSPPVMIRARARPGGRINDVHSALATGDEEPGDAAGDPNPDHALAATREMRGYDVGGAIYPTGKLRTGCP